MSRVAKWNLEKTKVKVVFRLQFHATHIPQAGWDKLLISFIPADSGKATAKTTKANVRNGTCKWGDPIYETTRLLQDSKSKQYDEKLYKFVVAMGSSRSNILGEAIINLADYADALKPSVVALPLLGCNFGTILHVTVQLLSSKTGFREFEQQRELRERGLQSGTDLNRHEGIGTGKASSSEEVASDQIDKVNPRLSLRPESKEPSLEEETRFTEEYADSAVGFDGSSNTSGSIYAEKLDASSTHEIDSLKSTVSGDLNGLSHCQSPQEDRGDTSDRRILAQGSSDWVHGWSSDYSMDPDLATAYEENSRLRGSLEVAESSILELKLEISSLQNHADEIGIETQKFARQLAAEIASGEELAKEVSVMKSECSKLKDDLEQLKTLKLSPQCSTTETGNSNQDHLFQGTHVRWMKGILVVEDKMRELQNKVQLGFPDRDLRFLHSDLEALFIVLQELKQGTGEAVSLPNLPLESTTAEEMRELSTHETDHFASGNGLDVDLYHQPDMLHCLSARSMMSQEADYIGSTNAMKGKIFELLRELDEAKAERESLARKMDQMECYYEALVQELEESQKQMVGELQSLRNEHSTCLYTIAATSSEMESIRQDMNEKVLRFTEDRLNLDAMNKELERRAISSEAALRRARLNYSIAVDQLQKDLGLLSFQVISMFETNENLVKQTFSESIQPLSQGHPGSMRSRLEESDASKFLQLQTPNTLVKKQVLGGDILLEDMKKSLLLQEGLYQKVEEELSEMHEVNVYLDVFSKILQETLLESTDYMKTKIDELAQQLDISTDSKKLLMLQLQTTMDDVQTLSDYKASCIAKNSHMALQNQTLEARLEGVSNENFLLSEKIVEWEALLKEYQSYERKYEVCYIEKTDLENLLKQETLNKANFQNEISSLKEELKIVKAEQGELAFSKENLQKIVNVVEDKLQCLLASYTKKFNVLFCSPNSLSQDWGSRDLMDAISQLEEIQRNTCKKILQLLEEKKNLEDERDLALVSSSTANSEILVLQQKFKHDMQNMATKLQASNALVEKLQLELEAFGNKLQMSSKAEETYAYQNDELLADLTRLEVELQQLTSKNMDLAKEILGFDTVTGELGRSKLIIDELAQERQDFLMSLHNKTEESVKLAAELGRLKESMRFLHDELHVERSFRDSLEGTVADLKSQLEEKHDHLLRFSQQEAELVHFRQLASDLELEKSGVSHILLLHEECLGKLHEESSRFSDLESQSSEMLESLIAADLKVIFISTQYEAQIEELALKLQSSGAQLGELRKKFFHAEIMLNRSLAGEAHSIEENANLTTTVESLRSELKSSVAQHGVLSDLNGILSVQLEEFKQQVATLELDFSKDQNERSLEVEQLKHKLLLSAEEIDNLMLFKEELEITGIVLKVKLNELHAHMTSMEECDNERIGLQHQCNALTHKLSEQILKTEEFKNLSIHLKELKDKAEAECLQAREKRETEGPPVAAQDSLRIAFIKEQYETRLQELRHQVSVSKKHGEEMLWKLQDAVDELENRKKSEASHLRRNEELSLRILEMEAELQSVVSEKREKIKVFDLTKAELECALLSLECCKEEKQKIEASLQEYIEENNSIATELTLTKGKLDCLAFPINSPKQEINGSDELGNKCDCLVSRKAYKENPVADASNLEDKTMEINGGGLTKRPSFKCSDQHSVMNCEEGEDRRSIPIVEGESSPVPAKMQPFQDVYVTESVNGISKHASPEHGALKCKESMNLAVINAHFRTQSLKSSMDHLHKELERMKSENSLLPLDDHHFDPKFQGLQTELMQLHKANEELRSIFPLFNEFTGSGNALERVLALEVELAEALRAKKKSSILFQSSFLKQHSDEQAVFQSFSDINELIKEMLELKGRHAAVEGELKDMHDRYSQLSLQFAEVEGERQKLMMTLRNVRAAKKLTNLNRSSSATIGDHP